MKAVFYNLFILVTIFLLLFNITGCGKKSMPIPEVVSSEEIS